MCKAIGVSINNDAWVFGFNQNKVIHNTQRMVGKYNLEVVRLSSIRDKKGKLTNRIILTILLNGVQNLSRN
ncbi:MULTISPECIES: hypothetical protein [Bacillus subtilis group]|uniref:hypothetical protein n=1 Tax=Bacillus subtilis group TaxID=653685 RepID=UPI00138AD9E4